MPWSTGLTRQKIPYKYQSTVVSPRDQSTVQPSKDRHPITRPTVRLPMTRPTRAKTVRSPPKIVSFISTALTFISNTVITPQEYIKLISDLKLGVIESLVLKQRGKIIVIRLSSCLSTLLPRLGETLTAYYDKEGTVIAVPFTITLCTDIKPAVSSFDEEVVIKLARSHETYGGSRKRAY